MSVTNETYHRCDDYNFNAQEFQAMGEGFNECCKAIENGNLELARSLLAEKVAYFQMQLKEITSISVTSETPNVVTLPGKVQLVRAGLDICSSCESMLSIKESVHLVVIRNQSRR